jgi:hypothetical protein
VIASARAELWREYQFELAKLRLAIDVTSGEGRGPTERQRRIMDHQRRLVRLLESAWQSTWTESEVAS